MSARRGIVAKRGWKRPFEDPIPLPRGRQLVTLKDAADYIMKLTKAEQNLEEWQTATEALLMAAEDRGPLMHARIGHVEGIEPERRTGVQSRSQRHAVGKTKAGARSVNSKVCRYEKSEGEQGRTKERNPR
jgi:hypothetical protein